jgi:hypothetical protein
MRRAHFSGLGGETGNLAGIGAEMRGFIGKFGDFGRARGNRSVLDRMDGMDRTTAEDAKIAKEDSFASAQKLWRDKQDFEDEDPAFAVRHCESLYSGRKPLPSIPSNSS